MYSKYKKINKFNNKFENTIDDIIDESVFKNSGLRLTGSRKGSYISQTKEFVDEGRPYNLLSVFKNNEIDINEQNELVNNMLLLINKTSILSKDEYILNIKNNPNLECEPCDEDTIDNTYNLDTLNSNKDNQSGNWKRLQKDDIRYRVIINFFNVNMPIYNSKDIKRIFYSDNENVYILCSQSKYCTNIGKNHNSEHIYFKLTKYGICQRCFCRCDTLEGRKRGYCKDYASELTPLVTPLPKILNFKEINTSKSTKDLSINEDSKLNISIKIDNLMNDMYNQFTNTRELIEKKPRKTTKKS